MVTEPVTVLATCGTGSILGIDRVAEPIPQGSNKLLRLEEETESCRGNGRQPIASVGIGEAHTSKPCNLPLTALPSKLFRKEVM